MALERFDWKTCFSFKGIKGVRAAYELKGEESNDDFYFYFFARLGLLPRQVAATKWESASCLF